MTKSNKLKYVFLRDQSEWFWYNFRSPKNHGLKKQNSKDRTEEYSKLLRVRDLKLNSIRDSWDDLTVSVYHSKSWKDRYKVKRQYMVNI